MSLFMQMVLDAACSLRAASGTLQLLRGQMGQLSRAPVPGTGQLWLLRVGLFELTRPKEAADDWIWIVDHTVQIGTVKCLLMVGCRLSVWRTLDRPLEHRDLQVFALEPVEKSDGATVYRQLEQTRQRTGIVPRAILSDEGTDLKGGIQAFRQAYPGTTHSLDIAHQAANLLRRQLEADPRWSAFVGAAGRTKQRLAQTPWAYLLPPTPREKARYMNLEPLVRWGRNVVRYLDDPRPVAGQDVDLDALRDRLGWLSEFREALAEWGQVMATIDATLHYVRRAGYHPGAGDELRARLAVHAGTAMSQRLGEQLVQFVELQSAAAATGERLIGSSECLESLIGKGKRLESQQSRSGFTRMVLATAAAVVQPTKQYLTQALTHVKTQDVWTWCREQLGVSVQSQRRRAFATAGTKPA